MICSICGKECGNMRFIENGRVICQRCFVEKHRPKPNQKRTRIKVSSRERTRRIPVKQKLRKVQPMRPRKNVSGGQS